MDFAHQLRSVFSDFQQALLLAIEQALKVAPDTNIVRHISNRSELHEMNTNREQKREQRREWLCGADRILGLAPSSAEAD